jgi:hypothetical protein
MLPRTIAWLAVIPISLGVLAQAGDEYPIRPYVDPSQLDCPWPKHSHYKQPWRAFLETRSGYDFLHGVGINYNVPGNDEVAIRLLSEMGIRAMRIEIGWSAVNWEETGIGNADRMRHVLQLCKQYGIRPTMLLNAHHGVPGPTRFFTKRLAVEAPAESRTMQLTDTADIVPKYTGPCNLTDYRAAEVFITGVDPATGICQLSKPLPKAIKAGVDVPMATLKYLPLYPVGTPEFEATATGWLRYAKMVTDLVAEAGIDVFDVEIWNELSFGSCFTNINNYYDPPAAQSKADFLHPGGQAWEIAKRTVDALRPLHPKARFIWGFSNTTFFHCPIDQLPPGIDGQSYHPYGTGTRKLPEQEYHKGQPGMNLEGYTPTLDIRMSEGWAHTFLQTESLMRLLNPEARNNHPQGTAVFHHYMTEHGIVPAECGVTDEAKGWELKAKCALRSYCLWMNKGIDTLEYYCAYDQQASGMGLLPPKAPELPATAVFDQCATLPMQAIRNLTRGFAGAAPLAACRQLGVDVISLGPQLNVFEGDATHPPLPLRGQFAFLPFQVTERKFVIPVYMVTYDATRPPPPQTFRLAITGLGMTPKTISLSDPMTGKAAPVKVLKRAAGTATVEIAAVDYPRLLTIEG